MSTLLKAALLSASVVFAGVASATTIYNVSSTPNINCGTSPHGLWTNQYDNTGCNEYFDFQAGSTLTVDGVTAVLDATAVNGAGTIATINITFSGFQDEYDYYKTGGTPDYDGDDFPVDWDFYSFITTPGTISFDNGDDFSTLLVYQPSAGVASPDKPVLQIGNGANDKSAGFGASAWLDVTSLDGGDDHKAGAHWDLNMSLTAVPEPSPFALLGLGLFGLVLSRRKA